MNINPGNFDKKIILQTYTAINDEIGNSVQLWSDLITMQASVNSLYGKEYWAAASQGQEDTIVFTTRWTNLIDNLMNKKDMTKYRIVFKGKIYSIKYCDNVKFKNKIVKIKAVSDEI